MIKKSITELILTGILASSLSLGALGIAATPYWDNSFSGSQTSSSPNQSYNSTYEQPSNAQDGYGQSNNNNYQQNSNDGQNNNNGYQSNSGYGQNSDNYNQPNSNYSQNNNNGYQSNNGYGQNSDNYNQSNNSYNQDGNGYNNNGYRHNRNQYNQSNNGYNDNNGYGEPQNGYNNGNNQQPSTLRGYVWTAPAGTSLSTTNTTYLSSGTSHIGDPVTVTLSYDLAVGGNVVLPSGTQVRGEVVSSVPAGRVEKNGELQIRFNQAVLPDGRQYPLSARLITQDGTGIIRGGTRYSSAGSVAKNTLGGAALGGLGGAALGAIVGGHNKWDEGLLWGSILGAGGGLVRSGIQRGSEAQLQPGQQLQIMLDQPLTVTRNDGNSSY